MTLDFFKLRLFFFRGKIQKDVPTIVSCEPLLYRKMFFFQLVTFLSENLILGSRVRAARAMSGKNMSFRSKIA